MGHFKKEGGGEFKPQDLITLSFDEKTSDSNEEQKSFKEVKAQLGSKFKIDGVK
jgi:hypothetical protein